MTRETPGELAAILRAASRDIGSVPKHVCAKAAKALDELQQAVNWADMCQQDRDVANDTLRMLLDGDPVAYLWTLHMELAQTRKEVTLEETCPFGEAGKDYDESYVVTCAPLHAGKPENVPPRT